MNNKIPQNGIQQKRNNMTPNSFEVSVPCSALRAEHSTPTSNPLPQGEGEQGLLKKNDGNE